MIGSCIRQCKKEVSVLSAFFCRGIYSRNCNNYSNVADLKYTGKNKENIEESCGTKLNTSAGTCPDISYVPASERSPTHRGSLIIVTMTYNDFLFCSSPCFSDPM